MLDAISSRTQDLQALSEPALSAIDRSNTLPQANDRTSVAAGVGRMLGAIPSPDAQVPAERTLVASEDSVQAGGVRDAYDMSLYHEADGSFTLALDMKVEFEFSPGPTGQQWTELDKQQFMQDYNAAIEASWDGHTFTDDNGQQVKLDIRLDLVERSGDDIFAPKSEGTNWSIEVIKINDGEFNQSYVIPSQNQGVFDSEDVKPINKGASDPQVGAAHEFGHMIGLPDEYNGMAGPEAAADTDSIMHTGMDVRDRHLDIVESWVNANN